MDLSLREVQENLEQSWLDDSITQYKRVTEVASFSNTQQGMYLLGKAMRDLELAIKSYTKDTHFKYNIFKAIFSTLSSTEIGAITMKYLMDISFSGVTQEVSPASSSAKSISSLSIKLGNLLVEQLNYRLLKADHPRAIRSMEQFCKGKSQGYYYRTLQWWKNLLNTQDTTFETKDKAAIGYECLKLALETSGLFETMRVWSGNRMITTVVAKPDVLSRVVNNIEVLSAVNPRFLPMVVPPLPWTAPDDGGYLTLRTNVISHYQRNAELLDSQGHLGARYDCLNRLQSIPWEINDELLVLMTKAYTLDHRSVPLADLGVELPEKPWKNNKEYQFLKKERPEVVKAWAKRTAQLHTEFYAPRTVGQRMDFLRTLSIGRKFKKYSPLYFPWRMDYRGRFYPVPHTLTPQGSDFSKALLRFHKRTPMTPKDSTAWQQYLLQGAGLYGHDKVSLAERIQWVRQHHETIMSVARDPWAHQWWVDGDKPWCLLAWCLEYRSILEGRQDYTQLPVNRDGKCNGLQHLSMTIRDRDTGSLVSLVPLDKPSDIYTEVVKRAQDFLGQDSPLYPLITRSLVKRPTMTTPYNVTKRGMGDQIKDELVEESSENYATTEVYKQACELRTVVYDSIRGLLGTTSELMEWYAEVSKIFQRAGVKLEWVLPDNFKVIQDIPKTCTKKLKLRGATVVINYRVPLEGQDARRTTSAFSPNITHSMDATHMAMWIRRLPKDLPLACVHDSFGLTAPDMVLYGHTILGTFLELYDNYCPIEHLQQVAKWNDLVLPEPPSKGSLSASVDVARATYAFA